MRLTEMRYGVALALLAACVLFAMVGCGGGGSPAPAADTTAPTVSDAKVIYPAGFSFAGGVVTIRAQVSDASGVSSVVAAVTPPGRAADNATLAPKAGGVYEGTYQAPGNGSLTGADQTYSIQLTATDTAGNAAHPAAFTLVVPAAEPPPDQP